MSSESTTSKIYVFSGAKSPFSQWYPASLHVNGENFNCAEQYMMYAKAMLFGDETAAREILMAKYPKRQKALGRQIAGFRETVWQEHRTDIVYTGNLAKFSQNKHLGQRLLDTADAVLAEANPTDDIWAIGLAASDPDVYDPSQWRGQNLLGKVLMRVREALKE